MCGFENKVKPIKQKEVRIENKSKNPNTTHYFTHCC